MAEPKRLRILRALKALLEQIKESNGFATNAGDHVALGRYRIGAGVNLHEALPAISVTFGRTTTPAQGARVQTDLPVIIAALVREDQDEALAQAELVVGDIKRALYGPTIDDALGGLINRMEPGEVEPVPREEGSQFAGAQVELLLKLTEKRGDPEA